METNRRYRFSYRSIEQYDTLVSNYHFLLRCTPHSTPHQHIEEHRLQLLTGVDVRTSCDCFQNKIHYGSLRDFHDLFVISSSGVVSCDRYIIPDPSPLHLFGVQSHFTYANSSIVDLGRSVAMEGSHLDIAVGLSHLIYSEMKYRTGVTSVATTAADALEIREGVCQDFSHLLLSLCRERGVTARYVMGYLMGQGETHAWVEVWSDGAWYGIDPTHDLLIGNEGYIKVAHGRDAADCSVVRGMRRGMTTHSSQIRVVVEEVF